MSAPARPSLWIPGPTEVRPELLAECARPMIGHRTAEMRELIARLDPGLRHAFGLSDASSAHVAVHSCTASGLMEAVLRGLGTGRVLSLVNGAFSARFATIAESVGLEVVRLTRPAGHGFREDEVRDELETRGPFTALTFAASETSSATATPPERIAAAASAHPETLLLADCVTWLGGASVDFDRNRLDAALAGTQKALALPPGLGLLAVSDRLLERVRASEGRGWFLDLVRIVESHAERKPPMTPTLSLYRALARQLEEIDDGTLEARLSPGGTTADGTARPGAAAWQARFARHARMRDRTLAFASSHGLRSLAAPGDASPTVSCLDVGGRDVPAVLEQMKRAGFELGSGYGELKSTAIRIGHMGDHTESELEALLDALGRCL
ncbi:MAG: pyridoxal-phosphate-dependent aminotransferase family protein [Planctomycetota bacterium]|jgi:aspartate aminotransferase-like enzyme